MAVAWEDFTPVAEPAPTEVDWSQFAPVAEQTPAPVMDWGSLAERVRKENEARSAVSRGMESGTELTSAIAEHPIRFAMTPFSVAGDLLYAAGSDLGATLGTTLAGAPELVGEQGGNIYEYFNKDRESALPQERVLSDISKEYPATATIGKVAGGITKSLPMLAVMPQGALGKLIAAGFTVDMITHAGEAATRLGGEMGKLPEDRNADIITTALSDIAQSSAFAPLTGAHAGGKVIGERIAPRTEAIRELAKVLKSEPRSPVTPDEAAQIRLGLPPRAKPEMLPEVARTQELVDVAIQEAQQKIVQPGKVSALDLLKARDVEIAPEEIKLAERLPGGGEAPYGKVSFMREAEAPTTERTQVATQAERDMLQSVVDEAADVGLEIPKSNLPPGVSYRRPKAAPTIAEQEKRQARESVEKGLTQESGYYTDEPRTQSLPESTMPPERVREGVSIVSPETGRAIEKPIPLSALQRSRLRAALARGASEETILNILRLKEREPAQPQKRKESPNASPIRSDQGPILEEGNVPAESGAARSEDLQLTPQGQPEPVAAREVAPVEATIVDKTIQALQGVQKKLESGFQKGDVALGLPKAALNMAIDAVVLALKAGKTIGEALDAAVKKVRFNFKDVDEAGLRDWLTKTAALEAQSAAKPKSEQVPAVPLEVVPTKTVTPQEAVKMEKSVKLDKDVSKIKEQLDTFDKNIGEALTSGGRFLPKDMRPQVAKGKTAETGTVTSKEINQYFVNELVTARKAMQRVRTELANSADTASLNYFDVLQKRFELSFRKVQELRRASHEALYFWNEIRGEYQEIARMAGEMPSIKARKPILDQLVKDLRDKEWARSGRDVVDYLRVNLFTPFSFTLDFTTNLMAVASHTPAWLGMDLAHLVTGKPMTRTATALRALRLAGRNAVPFTEKFRLPQDIEIGLGTAAGGEFQGLPKEVMVDFSEILRGKPELASKLKNADYILGGPVRMKRAVDNFFGRFGATAELYNSAYQAGRSKGLKGDGLKSFVEEFVRNPPEEAAAEAIRVGGEFKFNRELPDWAERFANNSITKLAVEAYPRWTLQFTKWAGEMMGLDPRFFKKVKQGKATAEQTASFLAKAATGWGALYAFNQLFYNQVDPNTMEYVTEKGERIRLSGRQPFPELYMLTAMFRGDMNNAKAALPFTSVPFASMMGGQGGLLSPLVQTMIESWKGNYTAEMASSEMTKMVNNAIPGKSMLGLIRALYDPTVREGIGAPIPGVAQMLPTKINPTTGEPSAPMQRIPGTGIKLPTVGGTPFPGALRIQNAVEKALVNHGIVTVRPRRTSLIEIPMSEIPKELRREYEQRSGKAVQQIVWEGINNPEWQQLPFEQRRDVLNGWLALARSVAKAELAEKYQKSMSAEKPEPLSVQRLPKFIKELPARP